MLLDDLDARLAAGRSTGQAPVPTGFTAFDEALGGGLGRGDLAVFAGPPGVGKTILALQTARHLAAAGHPVVYVCYEHDQQSILARLLAQSSGAGDTRNRTIEALRRVLQHRHDTLDLSDLLARNPDLRAAFERLEEAGDRLHVLSGSARDTDLELIDAYVGQVREAHDRTPVLIVDYLQKVPTGDSDPTLRARRSVEGLKDMAMHHDMPVMALASLSASGLEARRLRLAHLDDTSSIAFEADVVVLLNDKIDAVAKAHLSYGGASVRDYPNWVVWSIAKNRSGPNLHNIEFRKDFVHYRFHTDGRNVSERMADDRLLGDAS